MGEHINLSKSEIKRQYNLVVEYHNKYLKKYGVTLPNLYDKNKKFTKNALVLVYLSWDYPKTRRVSKTEITQLLEGSTQT